jgi:hypothetical protein
MSADLIGTGSQPENTLSIFFMIRSAHCTAAATKDSVLGLERLSNKSSVVFRYRATRICKPTGQLSPPALRRSGYGSRRDERASLGI